MVARHPGGEGDTRPEVGQHRRQRNVGCPKVDRPGAGRRRLRELEPEHVEQLLAKMATAGRSRASLSRVRSYLGHALAGAER